jgi:signal transduction histidine kinase
MNSANIIRPSSNKTVRYIEWIILASLFFVVILFFFADPAAKTRNSLALAFLSVFTLCSLIFPVERPHWQRQAYILIEILLILPIVKTQWNFDILLYVVIAKSCFLLNRKEAIATVIAAGIARFLSLLWILPDTLHDICSHSVDPCNPLKITLNLLVSNTCAYIAASIFVFLLCQSVLTEYTSRQRAEVLAQQVETLAATVERSRIARDIHDSLGHTLTSLSIQVELAQKLSQRNPDQVPQVLNTIKFLTNQCLQDVNLALKTVRQPNFNFNEALKALIEQVKKSQSLTIHTDINLPILPLPISHQLYCIVQEGLTNVQKHAYASEVNLRGQVTPDSIILELEDDGKGFNSSLPHNGFGLQGMQERVQLLGGQFKIDSAVDRGTQIQVIIPR